MKFGRFVVRHRILILVIGALLLIPSVFGMMHTRINYDMLTYLPDDMETVQGQDILLNDFGKGAFSFLIVKNMPLRDVAALEEKIERINHVDSVVWYDDLADLSIPMEMLPDKVYDAFNTENSTMMAIFFDTSTSSDETMDAIREIRSIAGEQCFVSGISALVTDLKDLCEKEEPIYVTIAVILACIAMMIFMDSWLIPFIFLASIGISILLNMGSNYFLGEISYITKALSAVLQLAVTMDYSIFLWHSYNEQRTKYSDHKEAMASAINETFLSVIGSSMTTIAGFIDGILDGTIPPEKEKYYLGIVSQEVKRLSRLVRTMLDLSRIDSGALRLRPTRFDITNTVCVVLLSFEQKIEKKKIDVRGMDGIQSIYVEGDPDMLYQVVYNLVDNAVKFTNEGGYLKIELSQGNGRTTVALENSGPGIAPDELPMVFERFYKTDKSRSRDKNGMGLGLYLVKTIIRMHGGEIAASSEQNKFTRFEFWIPDKAVRQNGGTSCCLVETTADTSPEGHGKQEKGHIHYE